MTSECCYGVNAAAVVATTSATAAAAWHSAKRERRRRDRCMGTAPDDCDHGRPHIGQMGSADPLEKWMKKLKSDNMQKRAVFYVYVIF